MQYFSIWQDAIYTATSITSLEYLIYDEYSELLYAGIAVARPGENNCYINISRVVQNYLNSDLPETAFNGTGFVSGQHYEENAVRTFTLSDAKGNVLETYKFLNCWDYETTFSFIASPGMNYPLSIPPNTHVTSGMVGFNSVLTKQNKVRTTITTGVIGDYCGSGALYYSNRMGGWESFLIEGTIKKKDSFERYTITNNWETGTLKPGERTLVNTIKESWTLNTHLLTDEEAKRLSQNLFSSNNVYFHDLVENKIIPVTITDNSVEYKTRLNQKRKMFYMTINITSSQPKQRI